MDFKTRKLIKSHIINYLRVLNPSLKITKKGLFECPLKHEHKEGNGNPSCNIFPPNSYKLHCFNPVHGKMGDIFDLFRKVEPNMAELSDDEVGEYLVNLLGIKVDDRINKLLAMYHDFGWCLFPLQKTGQGKKSKQPVQNAWEKTEFRNIDEWREWIDSGLGVALNLGQKSNVLTIDIDDPDTFEKIKHLLGNTLVQTTKRGYHFIYYYDTDFNHVNHVNLRPKGYEMELRANNAYIVIAPTSVEGEVRKWNDSSIIKMPAELKKFLLEKIDKEPEQDQNKTIQKAIDTEDLGDINLAGLEGCCNNTFIKVGGILRKKLNCENTEYALHIFNKLLKQPMPTKDIRAMMRELKRYDSYDKKEMAQSILEHLEILEQSTARDLKDSLKYEKKDIEEILDYLVKEGKIQKYGKLYKLIKKVDWQTDFMSIGEPLNIKVPFFDKYARFESGSMIVLGGKSGEGKCITNGFLATHDGLIDIAEIGKYRKCGISKVSDKRIYAGVPKECTYRLPNYFYKEKTNHTIKIRTYYGFELEGTPEHPILVINKKNIKEFKQLRELQIGDTPLLICPQMFKKYDSHDKRVLKIKNHSNKASNLRKWSIDHKIDKDMSRLFGYILGDGSVEKNCIKIYQNKKDKNNIKEVQALCKILKLPCKIQYESNMTIIIIYSVDFVYYTRIKLFEFMPRTNQINLTSPNRRIPKCILQSTRECQIAFIEALFNCESSLRKTKRGGCLDITMASKQIIDALHIILLNFGIIARKTTKKVKNYEYNEYWRLALTEEMTYKLFQILKPCKYTNLLIDGFYQKNLKIKWIGNNQYIQNQRFIDKIVEIKHDYKEKFVYDFNMDAKKYKIKNQFWSNGFISHNTHLAANLIKLFVDQKIMPYYICTEAGSKFGKITAALGVKEGDYYFKVVSDPTTVELEDNAITIIDWLKPKNSDYAKTDTIYERLNDQLLKHKGLLIVFAQLRKNGEFFASDMIDFYASLVAKYCHSKINENGSITWDNENTYWKTEKIRDSKIGNQYITIPTHFNKETKLLTLRGKE